MPFYLLRSCTHSVLRSPINVLSLSLLITGCRSEAFTITNGFYTPEATVPNTECYERVWDFNYGVNVGANDSESFAMAIWPDNSGEFPGTLAFYPCTLDAMEFSCTCDTATYPDPATCEDRDAQEVDLFTAEGAWTSSTAFDVTFTYRRAIVWEDGTDSTCPDVCTSIWDFSEVLKSPL